MTGSENQIAVYQPNETVRLEVRIVKIAGISKKV